MSVILIADDDDAMAALLDKGLRRAGFETRRVDSGVAAVEASRDEDVDLVLLDVGLPDLDGVGAMVMMRALRPGLPILLVTGHDTSADVLRGFESGADDYVTKPFDFDELVARVRSRLRISSGGTVTTLQHGEVSLDLLTRVARVSGRVVDLSAREFALAEAFLRQPGRILDRAELLRRIWGFETDPGSNVVDVYVGYLRRKLGDDVVETVRGLGYRLGGHARS
jgi:two-component system, OmpR family, copper resistance phosphate regulon response regulator CusR